MMARAVVFDLDGTLLDSGPQIHADVTQMLTDFDLAPISYDKAISFLGDGVPALVERSLSASDPDHGVDQDDAVAKLLEIYGAASTAHLKPFDGALALLSRLEEDRTPLGICTNRPQKQTEALLARLDLRRFFDAVIGGDRLPVSKPDPAPLRQCFDELDVRPRDGLFIGDSETDERTAQNLGCPFALFTNGYRKKNAAEFDAIFTFDDFSQLRIP